MGSLNYPSHKKLNYIISGAYDDFIQKFLIEVLNNPEKIFEYSRQENLLKASKKTVLFPPEKIAQIDVDEALETRDAISECSLPQFSIYDLTLGKSDEDLAMYIKDGKLDERS